MLDWDSSAVHVFPIVVIATPAMLLTNNNRNYFHYINLYGTIDAMKLHNLNYFHYIHCSQVFRTELRLSNSPRPVSDHWSHETIVCGTFWEDIFYLMKPNWISPDLFDIKGTSGPWASVIERTIFQLPYPMMSFLKREIVVPLVLFPESRSTRYSKFQHNQITRNTNTTKHPIIAYTRAHSTTASD